MVVQPSEGAELLRKNAFDSGKQVGRAKTEGHFSFLAVV